MSRASGVAPARRCAYQVLRRVFEQGAYADRALRSEARELEPRDRALATALVYGAVQRRATLDFVIERLAGRPATKLDSAVLIALRLGVLQLLYLDRIAEHAAVDDSVELAKLGRRGGHTLVNAVLRRAAREGATLLAELHDEEPGPAAIMHSVPEWLARMWWQELGPDEARALLAAINGPAESAVRVNTLLSSAELAWGKLPVSARPAFGLPEGLVIEEPWDAHGSELFRGGVIMPQSRASMAVSRVLGARGGERVLDLCSAPGAKATHLAALMGGAGEVVAVERNGGRARELEENLKRMRTDTVRVLRRDASLPVPHGPYDRVLIDPPCSGLGTLQSRPDLRWRVRPESVAELAGLQQRILARGVEVLARGGTLVYSVCTISSAEGPGVIEALLSGAHELTLDDLGREWPQWRDPRDPRMLQTLPHRHGTDGFFIARLRRHA